MQPLENIIARAKADPKRIVLAEGDDSRIVVGAARAAREGIARPILVGPRAKVAEQLKAAGVEPDAIEIADPATSPKSDAYADVYHELRKHKGLDRATARTAMGDPLVFAATMVRQGDADGTIGGAVATTAATVRTALQVIGKAPDTDVVSSCFLLLLQAPFNRPVVFADCGLILQPTSAELASIAIASAQSLRAFTGQEPRIAMLSFSTMGSVDPKAHESINRIRAAISMIRARAPELNVDGEMQFDAAILPDVGGKKAPGSQVAGHANVFVFPSLSAGNIGYKIAQRLGGAVALGPILQGLAKPANDLSRGCSVEDIFQMIAITGAQAATHLREAN